MAEATEIMTASGFRCSVEEDALDDMELLASDPSASYAYYQANIKPKPEEKAASGKTVWRCTVCGYIYEGEELPADFVCPLCKHPASDFEKVSG